MRIVVSAEGCDCGGGGTVTPVDPGTVRVDYSLEEQFTGRHWVDGKKIYQKTIFMDAGPNIVRKVSRTASILSSKWWT